MSRVLIAEVDRDRFTFNGMPFSMGVVDTRDGQIEQVVTYRRAESEDWHHSFIFKESLLEKIEDGNAVVFWFEGGQPQVYEGGFTLYTVDIPKAIMNQVEPIAVTARGSYVKADDTLSSEEAWTEEETCSDCGGNCGCGNIATKRKDPIMDHIPDEELLEYKQSPYGRQRSAGYVENRLYLIDLHTMEIIDVNPDMEHIGEFRQMVEAGMIEGVDPEEFAKLGRYEQYPIMLDHFARVIVNLNSQTIHIGVERPHAKSVTNAFFSRFPHLDDYHLIVAKDIYDENGGELIYEGLAYKFELGMRQIAEENNMDKTKRGSYVKLGEEEYKYQIPEGDFTIDLRNDQGVNDSSMWLDAPDLSALDVSYPTQEEAKAAAQRVWDSLGDHQAENDVIVMDSAGVQIDYVGIDEEDMYTGD